MATQSEIASHIDLSTRQISNLLKRGILPPAIARGGLNIDACRLAYIRYLRGMGRNQISELSDDDPEADVNKERAWKSSYQ